MKIEKLPSGSYRIRQQYKGKRYTVTVPYKPTTKEAMALMSNKMDDITPQETHKGTFQEHAEKYLEKCEERDLSPSTIRGYVSILKNMPSSFLELNFGEITEENVQKCVDAYSRNHSPKSTANFNGFIRAVIGEYRPQLRYSVDLPKKHKKAEYEPTTEDVMRIIEACKDTEYEIAIQLCCLGLRLGEVLAITSKDVSKDNVLTINKDMVKGAYKKEYVLKKKPKTEASNRRILIPSDLADLIREKEKAYTLYPNSLNRHLHKIQRELGIPPFRLQLLRHFAAAYLHKKGFTDQQILSYGGWENDSNVMKRVYRYNLDPHESQKQIADTFDNIF